ncbi:MAG: Sjogren's syndrome/scleroderma autoantigen 1 family protein [Thermoprotei archaeon]
MSQVSKKIASALMEGGKLLAEACPVCASPLVQRKNGEVYCLNCDKKVVIVSSDEEALGKITVSSVLYDLEELMMKQIRSKIEKIKLGTDEGKDLQEITLMLDIVKRIKELKA